MAAARPGGLCLTDRHLHYRVGLAEMRAPWDDLKRAELRTIAGTTRLSLRGTAPGSLNLQGTARLLAPIRRRRINADVVISPQALRVSPSDLHRLVTHLRKYPADRSMLTTRGALNLVARLSSDRK